MASERWKVVGRTADGRVNWSALAAIMLAIAINGAAASKAIADQDDDEDELPFSVAEILIETTDNDIELQVFVDDSEWKTLRISDPNGKKIFRLGTYGRLGRQGMTELGFASQPTSFPEDADPTGPEVAAVVRSFLRRFKAGAYEMEAKTLEKGVELESEAILTHDLPALPEIVAPVSEDEEELPVLDPESALIAWEPVTGQFLGSGTVEITGYQVIVEQVEPFRKLVINLPASATSTSISPEFLEPDQLYDFEVVAFEVSGNATISVGEFLTSP
jgi:hypothetical protein